MPDCFISHVSADAKFAREIHRVMTAQGLDVFLAPVSLKPGDDWTREVKRSLKESRWVLFLASRKACRSHYVQQEVGGAYFADTIVIPIVWNMKPEKLPGWTNRIQAIDLRKRTPEEIGLRLNEIASDIRASKVKGRLIALGLIGGLLWLAARSE